MALLVAATGPPRISAQLFPFTSLRHIFDNLKIRGGGNIARIHNDHNARPVVVSTHVPIPLSSSTSSSPSIFAFDPESSRYRKVEPSRPRPFTPIPIPASSNIAEQKTSVLQKSSVPPAPSLQKSSVQSAPSLQKSSIPPVPSLFLQPPPKDAPLRVDLSEVVKLASETSDVKLPDNSAASSQNVPKNHKITPTKKATNHRVEKDTPANHKRKPPSINTPRKRLNGNHVHQNPATDATMDVQTNRLVRGPGTSAPASAPSSEPEQSASHLEVPEGGEDRVEFQMHGLQGPKSYKFGYDTGKGQHRQFRYEERDQHGNVRGHYGYVDEEGKLQVVNYKADPHTGYHADVSKLNL